MAMDTWVSYGISAEYEVIFGFKIYWLGKLPSPSSPAHKEMFLRDSRPLCGDPGARACLLSLNVGVTNGCVGNLKWEDGLQHIRSHPLAFRFSGPSLNLLGSLPLQGKWQRCEQWRLLLLLDCSTHSLPAWKHSWCKRQLHSASGKLKLPVGTEKDRALRWTL